VFCPPTYFSDIASGLGYLCGVPSETTDAVREGGDAANRTSIFWGLLESIEGLYCANYKNRGSQGNFIVIVKWISLFVCGSTWGLTEYPSRR
jgi:hypothetical protein